MVQVSLLPARFLFRRDAGIIRSAVSGFGEAAGAALAMLHVRARASELRTGTTLGIPSNHSEPRDPNLSGKPPETHEKQIPFLKRAMVEKNGASTPRTTLLALRIEVALRHLAPEQAINSHLLNSLS